MKSKLTDQEKIDLINKYETGIYTCSMLDKEYNLKKGRSSYLLRTRNITINNDKTIVCKQYHFNESYFNKIDTEHKAYFLGLLFADGNVSQDKTRITLHLLESDKIILDQFQKELSLKKPYYRQVYTTKTGINSTLALTITSHHMCQKLFQLGCTPAKSLTLKWPPKNTIPEHLIRHFIRGYFDGDGSIFQYRTSDNYIQYRFSIISTNDFCTSMKSYIENELDINVYLSDKSTNNITKELIISGNKQFLQFGDLIYKDITVCLPRKQHRYVNYKACYLERTTK